MIHDEAGEVHRQKESQRRHAPEGSPAEGPANTVDAWRHDRMRRPALPLIEAFPQATWLTVGDGRGGTDARWLMQHGAKATPSDLSGAALARAKAEGLLADYLVEDAEAMTVKTGAFDFCLCKESFHHFARPMMALYEMLRVARAGVLLVEPNDEATDPTKVGKLLLVARNAARRARGAALIQRGDAFEEAGNYIYALSTKEVRKAAIALGYRAVATASLNDYYRADDASSSTSLLERGYRRTRSRIFLYDLLTRLRMRPAGLVAVAILKETPSPLLRQALLASGFAISDLPENPYASVSAGS